LKRYTPFPNKNNKNGIGKKLPKTPLKPLDFFHEHNVLLVLILVIEIQYFLC
jgi:hypothetical protein